MEGKRIRTSKWKLQKDRFSPSLKENQKSKYSKMGEAA